MEPMRFELNSLAQWCSSRHSLRSALCYAKLPPKACYATFVFTSFSLPNRHKKNTHMRVYGADEIRTHDL